MSTMSEQDLEAIKSLARQAGPPKGEEERKLVEDLERVATPTQYVVLARDAEPSDTSRWTMVPGIFDGPRRKALEAAYTALGASDRAMLAAVPLRSWAPEPVGVEVNRKVVFG